MGPLRGGFSCPGRARTWEDKKLGQRDFVISADEKTSIQARIRCHPTLAPASTRDMRVEHEYDRGGALAYLAAWDVHAPRSGKNLALCTTGK